jgi:hypothetical protein
MSEATNETSAKGPAPEIETDPEIIVRSSELEVLRCKAGCYDAIVEIGRVQAVGQKLAAELHAREQKLAETLGKNS